MAETLAKLNEATSPVWTSKCDAWPQLEPDEFDSDDLDATPGCACATGCYIDLLPRSDQQWAVPAKAGEDCKQLCKLLSAVPLRCCRVDLVIRRAFITTDLMGLGITAYLTSCGESDVEAAITLQAALAAFADAFCGHSTIK